MAVLLLLYRSRVGDGPKIPLRESYSRANVEGLSSPGQVSILCGDSTIFTLDGNGSFNLPSTLEPGTVVVGRLDSEGSCVTLQLEK